jgi:hypothetical protein
MKAVFFILITLSANIGFAAIGGMDSGGGLGLVCFKSPSVAKNVKTNNGYVSDGELSDIDFIQTLDLYEASLKRGLEQKKPKLIISAEGESFENFLERILSHVEHSFPALGENLKESQRDFLGNNTYWQEIGLLPMADSNSVGNYNTPLCTLTTLAVQFKEEESYYLNIDPRLFFHEKMSVESKAVLLLHEYMYLVARKKGRTNSRSTRLAISSLLLDDNVTKIKVISQSLLDLGFLSPFEVKEILWGEETYPRRN